MKRRQIILGLIVLISFALVACGGGGESEAAGGGTETAGSDAMSRPTEMTGSPDNIQEALGPDGAWIVIFTSDVTVGEEVSVAGEVYQEEGDDAPRRKIALYTQDSDRNVTERFTLTVPRLIVDHVNTRVQNGEIAGDVFVNAEGFEMRGATINGNLYFASSAIQESAAIDENSTILGETRIGSPADAASNPTEMTGTADNIQESLGPDGAWIVIFTSDVSSDEDLMVYGAVYQEAGDEAPRRKIALYTQDSDRNVTERFTLSAPNLIVHHMNTRVQNGTIAGDVWVEEEGFEMRGATIDGNLYFATEAIQASAAIDENSSVTGETAVQAR